MDMDNNWYYWVFVKNIVIGNMYIYCDGILFYLGSNFMWNVGKIMWFNFVFSVDGVYYYKGFIDEFLVWFVVFDVIVINNICQNKIMVVDLNYVLLELYYDFDDVLICVDKFLNQCYVMFLQVVLFLVLGIFVSGFLFMFVRLEVEFVFGMVIYILDFVLKILLVLFVVLFEYVFGNNFFDVVQNLVVYQFGSIDIIVINGNMFFFVLSGSDGLFMNVVLMYYDELFEIIWNVEIGCYIIFYGIGFFFGVNGFIWIYDVMDYQQYLYGMVDFVVYNMQELLDLKFVFVKGILLWDVYGVELIWNNF